MSAQQQPSTEEIRLEKFAKISEGGFSLFSEYFYRNEISGIKGVRKSDGSLVLKMLLPKEKDLGFSSIDGFPVETVVSDPYFFLKFTTNSSRKRIDFINQVLNRNAEKIMKEFPEINAIIGGKKIRRNFIEDEDGEAIIFFVSKKATNPNRFLPREIEGVQTDVQEADFETLVGANETLSRPLRAGVSIGRGCDFDSAGTLGCFFKPLGDESVRYLLTNDHVIPNEVAENLNNNSTNQEAEIHQPSPMDWKNFLENRTFSIGFNQDFGTFLDMFPEMNSKIEEWNIGQGKTCWNFVQILADLDEFNEENELMLDQVPLFRKIKKELQRLNEEDQEKASLKDFNTKIAIREFSGFRGNWKKKNSDDELVGIDCSFAKLVSNIHIKKFAKSVDPMQRNEKEFRFSEEWVGKEAFKIGRTTGLTKGKVVEFRAWFAAHEERKEDTKEIPVKGRIIFANQIGIENFNPSSKYEFSNKGDSGSVVYDSEGNVFALLHAEATSSKFLSLASPIKTVVQWIEEKLEKKIELI